jgi:hypothetical protein
MPAHTHTTGRRAARPSQPGEISAELAIGAGLLLLIISLLVQLALWLHAVNTAQTAAQEGARAARILTGSTHAGHQAARRYLARLGPQLRDPQVQVTRTATTTRVEIRAHIQAVVLGLPLPVRAAVESPTERLAAIARPSTSTTADAAGREQHVARAIGEQHR